LNPDNKAVENCVFQVLNQFLDAKTGYPFIDAGITQLKVEGWIHHIVRNAIR
jgi:deoxyribodipyrimidine photolyase